MELKDEDGKMRVQPTTGEKVVVAVVIALLMWVGATTLKTSEGMAVLNTKVDVVIQNQDRRIADLERRVGEVEQRALRLEQGSPRTD